MALIDDCTNYYKLDESSGDAIDAQGSNDGTVTNCDYSQTGKINTAYGFDGTAYISLPITLDTTISISMWINLDTLNDDGYLYDLRASGGAGYAYFDHNTNNIVVSDGTVYVDTVATQAITTGFHHVVVKGIAADINAAARIGSRQDGTPFFKGDIDEIGFFDTTLSTGQIEELYNSGAGLAYPFSTGTNTQINIGDSWKDIEGVKINIGDTWKDVAGMQINIGDTWKTVF